jgi:chromosome segregation ATPase
MALSAVIQFYSRRLANELRNSERTKDFAQTLLVQLLKEVVRTVEAESVSVDAYCSEQSQRDTLLRRIQAFRDSHEELTVEQNLSQTILKQLCHMLDIADNSMIPSSVGQLLDDLQNATTALASAKQSVRKLRKERSRLAERATKELQSLNHTITQIQQAHDLLNAQHSDVEQTLRKTLQKLKSQTEENATLRSDISNLAQRHEDAMNQHRTVLENLQSQYQISLSQEHSRFDKLTQEHQQISRQFSALKKAAAALKEQLSKAENSIASLKKNQEAEKSRIARAYEEQLQSSKASTDQVTSQLRLEIAELRETEAQLSEAVQSLETRNKKLAKDNSQLARENARLESKITADAESAGRDRKLAEVQLRSQEASTESKVQTAIVTAKAESEREQRRMATVFADAFRSFVGVNEQADVASFERLVRTVRSEMDRVNEELAAIKGLVNAAPGETAADAVAKCVFNSH